VTNSSENSKITHESDPSNRLTLENLPDQLTLEDALALTLMYNPELQMYSTEIQIQEARALQSSLFPNPEIEGEIEEFGGTGPRKGFSSAETTIKVSQIFELGGKRKKRTSIGLFEKKLAQWDLERKKLDVITKTKIAFIDLILLQEKLALSEHLIQLAKEVHSTIEEKVNAGKVSPLEGKKANIALSFSQLEMGKIHRDILVAKQYLSSLWGDLKVKVQGVVGDLKVTHPKALEHNFDQAKENPDLARLNTEMLRSQAIFQLEQANRIPNLTISAGVKHFEETSDQAYLVGLSFPLPLFDRNQGNYSASLYEDKKAKESSFLEKNRIENELLRLHQEADFTFTEITTLEKNILPNAEESFTDSKEAYLQGKRDYLDLLDAQRTLFEVKVKHLESLGKYHKLHFLIDRLIGGSLGEDVEK
jgi:cobalt-zinc-cadmium efflux system outer membrane protein